MCDKRALVDTKIDRLTAAVESLDNNIYRLLNQNTEACNRGNKIKAIQRILGVPADGLVGPETRRAIKELVW